jgi:hypothetical protein
MLSRFYLLTLLAAATPAFVRAADNGVVDFEHVNDPDTVAQVDAIIPAANWMVQPGVPPVNPTKAQVNRIIGLASNQPVMEGIDACSYQFVSATADAHYELLISFDVSGRGFCNSTEVVRRTASGYDVESFDGYEKDSFTDLNGDGIAELQLTSPFSPYEGLGCQAEWTSVFRWNGTRYVKADASFPAVYQQRLSDLRAEIAKYLASPAASSTDPDYDFELDMSCDYMERDRINRFLGIDPNAGLDRALVWANSADPALRQHAAIVLADINNPAALQALRQLTQGSNQSVAQEAQSDLAAPSFLLSVAGSPVTVAPGASATITITEAATTKFADPVAFSVAGLPSGVTARFAPAILPGSGATTLTISAAATASTGSYQPVIIGLDTSNASFARSLAFTLNIQAPR